MFIGRESELHFLDERYTEKGGQLVVLYGRRRVGKTETLRQFCKDKPHVFFSCTQSTDSVQLGQFSKALLREDIPASKYIDSFSDWESAFRSIQDLPYGEKKRLVVIDEFPYICEENRAIPSILQNLWDTDLKDKDVMIILCGSALSFVEKELLAEKNPLYGRATGIYKMQSMGFLEAMQFFPTYSPREKVYAYAALGGIPHYLRQWDPDANVEFNIKRHILAKGCPLYSETEFLLHQELREPQVYNAIIQAVAMGSIKLNEINQKSLIENTSKTSVYLKYLMELGIIQREFPIGTRIKTKANARNGIYLLNDHFFRFWYAFGFPNYSQLEDEDIDGVYKHIIGPSLHAFASYVFEDVCIQFVKLLRKSGALPFHCTQVGKWWGKTSVRDPGSKGGTRVAETEIDVLGISNDARKYLVGECKFKNSTFTYGEYLDVIAKLGAEKAHAEFFYTLFSENGFDERIRKEAKSKHLQLYTLQDIVEYSF